MERIISGFLYAIGTICIIGAITEEMPVIAAYGIIFGIVFSVALQPSSAY